MGDPMIRVLFVDDEDHIRSVLGRLFRNAPWQSAYAASGEEALERFASEGPFGVVITDERMPGMSGLDLLRRLRAEHPRTVRMVLSSYTDAQTVLGAINEGYVYKFLTKPWKNDVLFQTVADVVEALELRRENLTLQARLQAQEADIAAVDWLVGELESRPFEAPEPGLAASVLESAPVGVVALREDGTVAFANPEACRLLGAAEPASLLDRPLGPEKVLGLRTRQGQVRGGWTGTVWAFSQA
jgi:CheY-like chemotaxis protein